MNESIKNLTHAIARAVLGVEAPPQETSLPEQLAELSAELATAQVEIEQLERSVARAALEHADAQQEIARLLRVSQEYFQVIEDLNDQREQWKEMFFTQSRSHQGAQALLSRALWLARRRLEITLEAMVEFDKANAEDMIAKLGELEAPPIGEPMKFAAQMIALAERAKPQTDAFGERERITEAAAAAAAAPAITAHVAELSDEEQVRMTVPTSGIDAFLLGAVTDAILVAEQLYMEPSLDPPPTLVAAAWLRVCILEQALAATHHGDADGWFARRGAVMAATKAGAMVLAQELVRLYVVEPDAYADLFADMDDQRYQWAKELVEALRDDGIRATRMPEPAPAGRAADEQSAKGYLGHASRYPFEDR